MDIIAEFKALLAALTREKIEYAVCGGFAVNIHGYTRTTKDIDLLVRRESIEPLQKIAATLGFTLAAGPIPFGIGTPQERELHRVSKSEGSNFLTLDLMVVTPIFEEVWREREAFEWEGEVLSVVSLAGLITMKRLAGRKQDLADLEQLGADDEAK
jgi:hypothetical protein